jgi:hypothetical protein
VGDDVSNVPFWVVHDRLTDASLYMTREAEQTTNSRGVKLLLIGWILVIEAAFDSNPHDSPFWIDNYCRIMKYALSSLTTRIPEGGLQQVTEDVYSNIWNKRP